ncbi:hypothetical protein NE237_024405 [Protea cynaroides]|uniref:Uncharacterized protein n=1 Tax=Protea cynaroides TaxID=273540 RepID=A0A9Q0HFT1_9MAGN|nr:hypothetical protein NE237_024405 [Protea cynaroides]
MDSPIAFDALGDIIEDLGGSALAPGRGVGLQLVLGLEVHPICRGRTFARVRRICGPSTKSSIIVKGMGLIQSWRVVLLRCNEELHQLSLLLGHSLKLGPGGKFFCLQVNAVTTIVASFFVGLFDEDSIFRRRINSLASCILSYHCKHREVLQNTRFFAREPHW